MARLSKEANELVIFSTMESLVPENHLVRKLEKYIDWSFIYDLTDHLYSDVGRGRVDPVMLYKMTFINKLFGINSMRKTCEEIKVNVAYRWFLNLSFDDKVPDHSTYSQNYRRKFRDNNINEQIFIEVIKQLVQFKLVDPSTIFYDGTHIKANANKNKYSREEVITSAAKHYQKELDEEINLDRSKYGKKELKEKDYTVVKTQKVSKNDPESGVFHKGEKEKCFAYTANTACDRNGYILGTYLAAGNIHDSATFKNIYDQVTNLFGGQMKYNVMDAGYVTPYICKTIYSSNQTPVLPYKRPMTKDGFFKKYEYVYDEEFDCYICPNEKILNYARTDRDGYRLYKSNSEVCKSCPHLSKCTLSKNHQKVVTRHIWESYKEEAVDHFRHTNEWKKIYPQRKHTIERVFADAKSKHGIGFTRYTGKQRVADDVLLLFAAMNIKKMVTFLHKSGAKPSKSINIIQNYLNFLYENYFKHTI